MYEIGQSGGFLGRMLGLLLNTGLSLMKNVLNSLAKIVLIPLVLTAAAAAATVAAIQKKMFGFGHPRMLDSRALDLVSRMVALIVFNVEINDIMKIFSNMKQNNKRQISRYFIRYIGAILLGNLLTSKGTIKDDGGTVSVGQNF